jgi:hypothetical protein
VSKDEQVEALFPVGGPYGDDETRSAARAAAALVRYLDHATRHGEALPEPATVDDVLGSLAATVAGLDQLLPQVAYRLGRLAGLPGAYAIGEHPANVVGHLAAAYLGDARAALAQVEAALTAARQHTSRIGLNLPEVDR